MTISVSLSWLDIQELAAHLDQGRREGCCLPEYKQLHQEVETAMGKRGAGSHGGKSRKILQLGKKRYYLCLKSLVLRTPSGNYKEINRSFLDD